MINEVIFGKKEKFLCEKLEPLTRKLFSIIKLFKSHSISIMGELRAKKVAVKFRNFFSPFRFDEEICENVSGRLLLGASAGKFQ